MANSIGLENSLREICEGLRSSRVTDRKRNGEKLKEFLNMNAVPALLTENSLKRRGYSWNDLFDDINDYILKETEKFETSKTFESVTAPLCTTLLHLCVAGSNKGKAYIKCEKITEACLLVLKDSRLKRAIGDAYLNLLYRHVLPQEYYLGFITPNAWEELLQVCLSACTSNYSKLDDYAKLRLVLLVMKNAKNYCQFVMPLRDCLPKWKKCFLKVVFDKKSQEIVMEITVLLLETLSAECRLSMCQFMESILTPILKIYEQNLELKKKCTLFQLLLLNVSLHHPRGRHRGQEASMADNWDVWNKQLNNTLEIICLEIVSLQKVRKVTDELLRQYESFYRLSAAVYFQIFALTESAENDMETTSKRQKVCFNKNKTFNDLVDELRQSYIPWLGIILMYVKNYGDSISIDDFLTLTQVIQSLITGNNVMIWDMIDELTSLLLKNIGRYVSCRQSECDAVLQSLWSSCVRSSTATNSAHKAVHKILQHILSFDVNHFQNVNSLFKFYIERSMPITEYSVQTLSKIFQRFFNKYSYDETRSKCFEWMTQRDITKVDISITKELLLRLMCNENIDDTKYTNTSSKNNVYNVLFESPERCILFSEFELEIKDNETMAESSNRVIEINSPVANQMSDYFRQSLSAYATLLQIKDVTMHEYMKFIHLVIVYIDMTIENKVFTEQSLKDSEIFKLLQESLEHIYISVESILNSDDLIPSKIKVLDDLKNILLTDLGPFMSSVIRSRIHKRFFQSINKVLMTEACDDDEEIVYAGEEKQMNMTTLKHSCTLVLAAYCIREADYRQDLLKHILDPKMYDFTADAPCLFECIELLTNENVHESELIFTLMQYMVKDLYRDPEASKSLLIFLIKMLDIVWASQGPMKQNCQIMMKSYVTRCEKLHYPPHVAALVYESVAKTAMLNRKHNFDIDYTFENALTSRIKGDIHSLRLYCCYLLKLFTKHSRDEDTELIISELGDIFKIDVAEGQQLFLKDELRNRTLTVLHCYSALAQTKKALVHHIFTAILNLQREKSLNHKLMKKFLKEIVSCAAVTSIDHYVDKNIVSILYFWFTKKYNVDELPVYLLGCEKLDEFKNKYKKWLISADILWRKGGDVNSCDYLKQARENNSGITVAALIESSFSEIIMLCLPYMVTEKYALGYRGIEPGPEFNKSTASAQKLFHLTGQILENMKWTDLFVENVGDLVLMAASHVWDHKETMKMFNTTIPEETKPYGYTKEVFKSILEYFGELTGGNIMLYLCENQPLAIFQVLFTLWKTVLEEGVIEYKMLAMHAFITFFEIIPRGLPTDGFVCNFACKSLTHGIRSCRDVENLLAYSKAVKVVLEILLPDHAEVTRQSVKELVSVLNVKQKETSGEDVIDFMSAMAPVGSVTAYPTINAFRQSIEQEILNLNNTSVESLTNLRKVLIANKRYLTALCKDMSCVNFSEDCKSSTIHQLVYSLTNILKCIYYGDNIKIEACNCLSEIVTYDLKTLVTVPPVNTEKVVDIEPKNLMACVALQSLSQLIFDDDPVVTGKVADTLNNLLKCREGKEALELERVDRQILRPFTSSNTYTSVEIKIHDPKFDKYCAKNAEGIFLKALSSNWNPNDMKSHGKWLKQVTTALLGVMDSPSGYFADLVKVCAIKSSICRQVLPPLIGLLLHCSSEKHVEILSKQINNFFNHIWEQSFDFGESTGDSSQNNSRISDGLDMNQKMVVQYMLSVVDFVRLQKRYYKPRPERTVESLNYLHLAYDKVSWAASVADQHLAAIYYGELWAVAQNQGVPPSSPDVATSLTHGENIQQIFRKCYVSIGEMDAIEGCGTVHLTIEKEKRRHLINTGQYNDALLLHDIALSHGAPDADLQAGVVRSLHKSGMHHLALQYIKSLPESDQLNDIKYECLSFLGDWSEIVDTKDLEDKAKQANGYTHSVIKAFHYACLRECLNAQTTEFENKNKLIVPLNRAKLAISRLCQNLNMENCQSVYKVLSKLHLFSDIEEYFSVRINNISPRDLLDKWKLDNLPIYNDFKHMEPLISQRVLLLEHAAKSYSSLKDEVVALQIDYANLGLSNNRIQMSQRLIAVAKKLHSTDEVALVESEISWAKGHKEIALSLIRNVVTSDTQDVNLTARSLRQYGVWMAETKRDNVRDIINKYLLQCLDTVNNTSHVKTKLKVYYDIAKFADAEYKQVVAYMNSSIFENKVKCVESMRDTATSIKATPSQLLTNHDRKAYFTNQRMKDLDESEIANTRADKESFLHLAMRYYMLSLRECEENNLSVFRFISLWVNNPDFEFNESEGIKFEQLLQSIPSRKFVTVLPQLAPRLTMESTSFAENLKKVIKRCALEHPHHTLPILFALKNADKDKVITNAASQIKTQGTGSTQKVQEPRTVAAQEIVKQLSTENRQMALIVKQMEMICDATISLANFKPKTKESKQKIPSAEQITKLKDLNAIPIPTVTIPINNNCKYTEFPTLHTFENYFELVGGINCPKKITCYDSTGYKRILLVKDEDDMRQDAVMQQVFNIVNTLLEKDPVTSRNKLHIRTYKVVPMSKLSGVLEWCAGTIPIGVYLAGTPNSAGAHSRYRPQDITCFAARKKLTECHENKKTNKEKLMTFLKILREFKPVFHYFFTEHYLDPVTWYERRLAYTKSVATSSMVGYIIGLGDRHVQNILIDKRTAEVIHIDFGIAFDQGKTLHTPETVPFRLTQDIIAGFGSSGVEGIFRRSCEKTMQLLRDNSETLLTILEVLLCDPLYSWTVNPKMQQTPSRDVTVQGGSNSGLAERALLAVGSKLSGTEGGAAGGVAVPGQVARLLTAAADPANLCRLYPGWQPYL